MPTRLFALALLSSAALSFGQNRPNGPSPTKTLPPSAATLPATSPTAGPGTATPAPEPAPLTPAQSPPRKATVSYANGQLSVSASNSSLNQILRDASRMTGIKITGGVADERVFGDYGPAPAADVLASLLDGTGGNMLLVQGTGDRATELILTRRTGGVTPPNPNAQGFDANNDDDPTPRQMAAPQPPPPQPQPAPSPVVGPPPQNAGESTTPPAPTSTGTDSNQEQSPTGVRTPQQIYDQLMRMRQQQQQQQR